MDKQSAWTKIERFSRGGALTLAFLLMIAAVAILFSAAAQIVHGELDRVSAAVCLCVACAMAACAAALMKFAGPL
ncbi:hypothetical protein J4G52_37625 [Burkholderia cenocepacia]|uniref:hypothetical protein n=1 Tax=Burkholderia cenocepacia TaxID=95486 RepID=UPI001AA15493|nr:hypothetical protein [Burkholderia cenocepacia]MBO1859279.1 hypothetical protein [Burkholderia cenocepacia]